MKCENNKMLEHLMDLDGVRYVIDDHLGLWVKFDVKKIRRSLLRMHDLCYSLSFHNRHNERILGFDNTHVIEFGAKNNVAPQRYNHHWHRDKHDKGRPYLYESAEKLLNDFWGEVDKKVKKFKEVI